jgi:predicted ATP-grasp superfamily ATP-dependent carboligase
MRILVVEYVAGGGLAGEPLPPMLAREGAAMLEAAVADFATLADVITTRDPRSPAPPAARRVHVVKPGGFEPTLEAALAACDAALIVAPETGGTLAALTERVEAAGVLNLGSSSAAVRVAGDKLVTARLLASAGLAVPATRPAPTPGDAAALGFPVVLKPRVGAGSVGLRCVATAARLAAAWQDAMAECAGTARLTWPRDASPGGSGPALIAQRRVPGVHASVSLVVAGGRARALTLNGQTIVEGERFQYEGGVVPLDHPRRARALQVAADACRAVPGLAGHVGVDLVLGADATVIEINPRLTTAYVGLRRALAVNPAALILEAARGRLPDAVPCLRRVRFTAGGEVSVETLHARRLARRRPA